MKQKGEKTCVILLEFMGPFSEMKHFFCKTLRWINFLYEENSLSLSVFSLSALYRSQSPSGCVCYIVV